MRIMLLNDDLVTGGVAKHIVDLANGLSARGHRISVAAGDGQMRSRLDPRVRLLQLEFSRHGTSHKSSLRIIRSFFDLVRYLREERPDVLHSHKRLSDAVGRIAQIFRWTE
jgi:hypothetical protein